MVVPTAVVKSGATATIALPCPSAWPPCALAEQSASTIAPTSPPPSRISLAWLPRWEFGLLWREVDARAMASGGHRRPQRLRQGYGGRPARQAIGLESVGLGRFVS